MRSLIASIPDGTYHGRARLEDAGHGHGDMTISAAVTVNGDSVHIRIDSPPQVPYFINSYAGNSLSGIYLGLMMFAQCRRPTTPGCTAA